MNIVEQLIEALGKEAVLTQDEARQRSSGFWRPAEPLQCLAVVRPRTTEEVSTALRLCNEANQAVVPHGGLTGVSGGEVTQANEVVLSLERMNVIEELDEINRTVTVQAGVILQNLQKAVAEKGYLFPLDLGAKGSCMIGGNLATNAGGLQAIRYGVTRQLTLGLEVVLADGTIISSLNKMMKNNAGYDLKHLFIGSEGTLGIITKAVLKLEDAPKSRNTAFLAFDHFEQVVTFLQTAKTQLSNTLTTYELIWQDYYRLMTSSPSPFTPPLPQTSKYYVLIEALGQHQQEDAARFEKLLEQTLEAGLVGDAVMAYSQQDLDWFWGIREKVEFAFSLYRPIFSFDVSLAISDMESYIDTIQKNLKAVWPDLRFYAFGHMGDGNLHLFVHCGNNDATNRHQVEEMIFKPLQQIGGSITAEHGVGIEKKAWLHLSRTEAEIQLMKAIKHTLDPKGILNPGKIFE